MKQAPLDPPATCASAAEVTTDRSAATVRRECSSVTETPGVAMSFKVDPQQVHERGVGCVRPLLRLEVQDGR